MLAAEWIRAPVTEMPLQVRVLREAQAWGKHSLERGSCGEVRGARTTAKPDKEHQRRNTELRFEKVNFKAVSIWLH